MKKILVLMMVVSLGLFMVACGKKVEEPAGDDTGTEAADTGETDASDTDSAGDTEAEAESEEEAQLENLDTLEAEGTFPAVPDVDVDALDFDDPKEE